MESPRVISIGLGVMVTRSTRAPARNASASACWASAGAATATLRPAIGNAIPTMPRRHIKNLEVEDDFKGSRCVGRRKARKVPGQGDRWTEAAALPIVKPWSRNRGRCGDCVARRDSGFVVEPGGGNQASWSRGPGERFRYHIRAMVERTDRYGLQHGLLSPLGGSAQLRHRSSASERWPVVRRSYPDGSGGQHVGSPGWLGSVQRRLGRPRRGSHWRCAHAELECRAWIRVAAVLVCVHWCGGEVPVRRSILQGLLESRAQPPARRRSFSSGSR